MALARRASGQQHGPHRGGQADADGADVGLDELHGVVDREAGAHGTARGIDVQRDVLVRIIGLEEQQLGDDQIRHVILDRPDDEDHPFLQQARVDVVGTLAARRLLDDDRNQTQCSLFHPLFSSLRPAWKPVRSEKL